MHRNRFLWPRVVVVALVVAMTAAAPVLAGGRPFSTTLSGPSEVPAGDPDATGTATVWVNPGTGTVCYDWSVTNAATPILAAHIHHAPVGVAGPVVVPLPPTGPSSGTGCTTGVDRGLAMDILIHPSDYYINTHNAEFPAGAARGQLSRTP
ncbi:MAG TPA: CHRD domain-containing protein [Candidatus Limnocylindrales bacterium]|nr:CHRD domain-containing protein [Candidatus Limnocylindrales bacterium]